MGYTALRRVVVLGCLAGGCGGFWVWPQSRRPLAVWCAPTLGFVQGCVSDCGFLATVRTFGAGDFARGVGGFIWCPDLWG